MSATEGAMTDLSSANSTYLSGTVEEPELGSIDFRQSLRFFQDQLITNKGFSSPTNRLTNNEGTKFNLNFTDENRSEKHVYAANKNGVFDEEHKSMNNCKISIPTVDTILESVRVLRAIQKSQEQRGSSWSLNVANSDTDTNLQYIHILTNGGGNNDRNGSISDGISEEDEAMPISQNNGTQNGEMDLLKEKITVNGHHEIEQNCTVKLDADEIPSFWPRNSITQEIISNSTSEKINFEAETLTKTSSENRDNTPQSISNPSLDTEGSDSRNTDFEFIENLGELTNGTGGKENQGEIKEPIILNGCNNLQSVVEDHSTTKQSQSGTNLQINLTPQDEISNNSPNSDLIPENSQPFSNTEDHTEVNSFLEESPSENSKLGPNFPDISRIYRISWDSIDSTSATNSSLGEELSNKDSTDSKCPESLQMDKIACKEMPQPKEMDSKKKSDTNKEISISDNNALENEDALQKIPDSDSDIRILSSSSLSPAPNEHLRPGSVSDTCSSLYVSAECSPCPSFYEISDDNDAAYSNQHEDNENKKEAPCETWTTDSSETQLHETEKNESTTSTSNSDQIFNTSLHNPEATCSSSIPENIENTGEEINTLDFNKIINPLNEGSNFTENFPLATETVTEINQELPNTKSETEEKGTEINSNACKRDSNSLNSPLLSLSENYQVKNVTEINQELPNIKLETEEKRSEINPNAPNRDSNHLNSLLPAVSESLVLNNELTHISNQDRTHETTICSTETLKLTNGNSSVKNIEVTDNHGNETAFEKTSECEEANEIHGVKKFTTSSWNLEAIMDSLYTLPDSSTSKAFQVEETFQREVFILSQGAFCNYPEGNYTVKLEQQTLQIIQDSEINDLLTIPLNYGEVSFTDRKTLKLDNKLGRCLYFKLSMHEELLELKEALQIHCQTQWESECINLVHYPLKCHQNVVIVDLGSCSTRAGILMDEPTLPFIFFPSVCATDKVTGNHVYGKEALQAEVRQNSILSFPVRPSIKIIKHSIDMNLVGGLFRKIFHDLRVDPTQYTIQVCLPRSLSISAQNALVKLLLEDFKVLSVSLTHQALLTLYAHNVSTGIVVDIGDRMDILPVVDGFIVENGVTRLPYGGQRLIHHMKHALAEKHISLSNDIDAFVVQYIAENLSYIADNYEDEIKIATQYPDVVRKSIALQTFAKDNNCVEYASLDDARFEIPEGLFKPELWGLDNPGIHKLVQKAIQATSVDVRKKIAENIYVSGGVTLLPGFVERLFKEVELLNKPRITPKVIASNYRYHCTYIGACKFANMEVFPKVCVNMEDYSKNQSSSLKKFVLCF